MDEYTREDFLTPAPYEEVLSIENNFEREVAVTTMATYAATLGVRNFKKLLNEYLKAKANHNKTLYVGNVTNFTGQSLELDAGKWSCDDYGVKMLDGFNDEVACPHPILPVERLVNIDTGAEKLKLAFSKGRRWREIIVEKSVLASNNKIIQLSDNGIAVTSENSRAFVRYISDIENINYDRIKESKSIGRLGHISGEGFSPYVDDLVFDGDASYKAIFSCIHSKGSSAEWKKTASSCRNESLTARIVLAASFASVLVEPFGVLPFFVHLWGSESGTGKTVGLMLAASVWGDPALGKYIQTFNSTTVGQEKTAAFLNSLPFLIDELQLAKDNRGRVRFNVYELAQGVGRTRGTKSGGIEKTSTWANCILTTGESPLTSLADGAGALNRVIDIECRSDDKVVHDGPKISSSLKKNYGFAGKAFVKKIYEEGVTEAAEERYKSLFKELSNSDTTEKQAMAAAIVIVADELISKWFFSDSSPLSVAQISTFLQTKASVSTGERGYRYMCDWVSQNASRLRKDIENGDIYGVVEGDWAFIISKVFREAAESGGFSSTALLSFMKSKGLLQARNGRNTIGKRIGDINTECIAMLIAPDGEFEDFVNNLDKI